MKYRVKSLKISVCQTIWCQSRLSLNKKYSHKIYDDDLTQEQLLIDSWLRMIRSSQDDWAALCSSWHTSPQCYTGPASCSAWWPSLYTCHVSPPPPGTCHTCTGGQLPRRSLRLEDTWCVGKGGKSLIVLGLCINFHTCRFSPYYFPLLGNMFSDFLVLSLET